MKYVTENEKKLLLEIAKNTLHRAVMDNEFHSGTDNSDISKLKHKKGGVFVSLYLNGKLRGCIGSFSAKKDLITNIKEMTYSAAIKDNRFLPVSIEELPEISIEISILTEKILIEDINQIELGKHGIYIIKGNQSGTFLPQVANKMNWDILSFLGHCSRDKAGIGWDGWRKADIYIYEAIVFGDKEHRS